MRLKPILTEKSMKLAKEGKYTFNVDRGMGKAEIKSVVAKNFDVHVVGIKTLKIAGEVKRTVRGGKRKVLPGKKAIVILKEGEKIDLFHEKPKKNTK